MKFCSKVRHFECGRKDYERTSYDFSRYQFRKYRLSLDSKKFLLFFPVKQKLRKRESIVTNNFEYTFIRYFSFAMFTMPRQSHDYYVFACV